MRTAPGRRPRTWAASSEVSPAISRSSRTSRSSSSRRSNARRTASCSSASTTPSSTSATSKPAPSAPCTPTRRAWVRVRARPMSAITLVQILNIQGSNPPPRQRKVLAALTRAQHGLRHSVLRVMAVAQALEAQRVQPRSQACVQLLPCVGISVECVVHDTPQQGGILLGFRCREHPALVPPVRRDYSRPRWARA